MLEEHRPAQRNDISIMSIKVMCRDARYNPIVGKSEAQYSPGKYRFIAAGELHQILREWEGK
jgi:hypothetical protein